MSDWSSTNTAFVGAITALAGCVAHLYHRVIALMKAEATCRQMLAGIKAELQLLKSTFRDRQG